MIPKRGTPENHCTGKRKSYDEKFLYSRNYVRCTFEQHEGPHSFEYVFNNDTLKWEVKGIVV